MLSNPVGTRFVSAQFEITGLTDFPQLLQLLWLLCVLYLQGPACQSQHS